MASGLALISGTPGSSLVLGFFGKESVHRRNAEALLEDFIRAYHRNNKGAKVRFILAIPDEGFTDTLEELADYAITSDYQIGLVGHPSAFEDPRVQQYVEQARGSLCELSKQNSLAQGMVNFLGAYKSFSDVKLILLANPAEDDLAYIAVEVAMGKDISVRSLLNGLDMVTVTPPENEEQEQIHMAPRPIEEEEELEEEIEDEEDEEIEDEEEPEDEEFESAEVDEDEDEDAEVEEEDEEADEEEDEEEVEEEDADVEEAEEEEYDEEDVEEAEEEEAEEEDLDEEVPEEEEEVDDDEDVEEEEEEEVPPVKKAPAAKKAAPTIKRPPAMTQHALTELANRDKQAFYTLARKYKYQGKTIRPGRGMKVSMMVNRILEAAGKPVPPPAPRVAKKTPAKKVAATKKAAPARAAAPVKKAGKVAAAKKPARTAPAPAAGSSTTQLRRAAIKAARVFLEYAEAL